MALDIPFCDVLVEICHGDHNLWCPGKKFPLTPNVSTGAKIVWGLENQKISGRLLYLGADSLTASLL